MEASGRQPWLRAALVAGVLYFAIGRAFAVPTTHAQAWRLAAWLVSGVVFLAHIGYEYRRLRYSARPLATHVATAVAVGAFLIAIGGFVHTISVGAPVGARWLLALFGFPLVTALPAFVVALIASAALDRIARPSGGRAPG